MEHDDISRIHFHIRWSGVERIDWESFRTREEAASRAKQHARPDEEYAIEELDGTCWRCRPKFMSAS